MAMESDADELAKLGQTIAAAVAASETAAAAKAATLAAPNDVALLATVAVAAAASTAAWDRVFAAAYERVRKRVRFLLGYNFPRLTADHGATSVTNLLYLKLRAAFDAGKRPTTVAAYMGFVTLKTRLLLIDLARGHDRRPAPVSDSSPLLAGQAGPPSDDPAQLAAWAEFHEKAESLLTPEEWQIFHLWYYGGLTVPQIAALLNMNERTVRRRLASAIEKLGDFVDPPG